MAVSAPERRGRFRRAEDAILPTPALRRLAAVIEATEDAVVAQSYDGSITSWNPGAERLYGRTAGDVLGRPFDLLIPPDRAAAERAVIRRVLEGEPVVRRATRHLAADGRAIEVSVTALPIRDAGGRITEVASIVHDASDRRNAERALERERERLVGVRALLAALDARDQYTGAHSEAVVALAATVARRLGLPPQDVADVEHVALLHDIGKIGVPDSILQKPGKLTRDEWRTMCEHPAIGERIVRSIGSLAHLAGAIRAEHERWDGAGYPDRLAGEQIPLPSRIILACDALHAMTSDRPYRAAMPLATAVEELETNAGTQFDPDVVKALVAEVAVDEQPAQEVRAASTRCSIMVVEDNAGLRLALEEGLASEGFRVTSVADSDAAYEKIVEARPALVLLDWILPGGGGAPACRRLLDLHPQAKVVVFTGLTDLRDRRAAREAGATDFLQKGIPLEALADRLRQIASGVAPDR